VALVGAGADFLASHLAGTPESYGTAAALRLKEIALWLALAPAVLWTAARLAESGLGWPSLVLAHLVTGFAAIAVHLGLVHWLAYPVGEGNLMATVLVNDLCLYAAVAVGTHAWTVRRVAASRRAAASRLDAELVAARLEVVRWRLRPELLYQALERIGQLSAADPDRADDLTGRLGELLRLILQSTGTELIPLGREAEIVAAYIELQGALRGESASLGLTLDPVARTAAVPAMLLQRLVESLGGTEVSLAGSRRGDAVELVVRSRPADRARLEESLPDLRWRLEQAYRGSHWLTPSWNGTECCVTLRIPCAAGNARRAVA
jgi:hypothetical protein